MAGKPHRGISKEVLQLCIEEEAFGHLAALRGHERLCVNSTSALFETIVLLFREIYIAEPEDTLAAELCQMKGRRIIETALRCGTPAARRRVHLTIDKDVVGFMGVLQRRCARHVASRNELAELLIYKMWSYCDTPERTDYMLRRLKQVRLKFYGGRLP